MLVPSRAGDRVPVEVIGEVSDGLEAVQKAEDLQPDLILLDIGLPKLNGLEVANRIQRVAPSSKIVFLTSENGSDVVHAALSNGAKGYVLKLDAGREQCRGWKSCWGVVTSLAAELRIVTSLTTSLTHGKWIAWCTN